MLRAVVPRSARRLAFGASNETRMPLTERRKPCGTPSLSTATPAISPFEFIAQGVVPCPGPAPAPGASKVANVDWADRPHSGVSHKLAEATTAMKITHRRQ